MEVMETTGMTDLQFKSWLKQIIRGLEGAKEERTKEDTDKKIEELLKDLKEDLQGQKKGGLATAQSLAHILLSAGSDVK